MLSNHGIKAGILPLFSNAPVTEDKVDWLDSILRSTYSDRDETTEFRWVFGFFGGISPTWQETPLFTRLIDLGKKHRRRMVVISIGNLGAHGADMIARWKEKSPLSPLSVWAIERPINISVPEHHRLRTDVRPSFCVG